MWSFDIFDTCLVRRQAFPTDLFLDLAKALREQLQPILGSDYAEIFRDTRVEAERLALERSVTEETSLLAIWDELGRMIPGVEPRRGMEQELQTEAESLLPVLALRRKVEAGRSKFGRVVFISDTYLPTEFLELQLARHGFIQSGDLCFASSAFGLTKRSGRLFALVAERLALKPAQIRHHGDNVVSDVASAQRVGFDAELVRECVLSQCEQTFMAALVAKRDSSTSRLVGGMRAARVGSPAVADFSAKCLVEDFVGPALWIFADWVLTQAASDGVQALYFFSRDACALHRVASILAERRGIGIDCRYLHVSRQALLLPSVTEVSAEGMPWLRRQWEHGYIHYIAGKLDLETADVLPHLRELVGDSGPDFRISSEQEWQKFWQLLRSPPLHSKLLERIQHRRTNALAYLKQEGLFEPRPIGIVDLGWHQSCQAALTRLIQFELPTTSPQGYYLGLVDGRSVLSRGLPAQALFHRAPNDRRRIVGAATVFSIIGILEHVLSCAPNGTVHHYEANARTQKFEPVYGRMAAAELKAKTDLLDSVERFAELAVEPLNLTDEESYAALEALMRMAQQTPATEWAEVLGALTVADDQNGRDTKPLIRARTWVNLLRDTVRGTDPDELSVADIGLWPKMSLAASPRRLRKAYAAVSYINAFRRALRWRFNQLIS